MEIFMLFSIFKIKVRALFFVIIVLLWNSVLFPSTINMNDVSTADSVQVNEKVIYKSYGKINSDSLNRILHSNISTVSSHKIRSLFPKKVQKKKNINSLENYRLWGEYLGGSLLGLAALYLADMTYSLGVNNNIWKDDVSGRELLVCDIGYVIGNQLGVYIIGNIGNKTGSLPKTLIYGTVLSLGIQYLVYENWNDTFIHDPIANSLAKDIIEITTPTVIAIMCFNLTRKHKAKQLEESGLINFDDKRICFDVPGVFLHPIYGENLVGVKVMNVNF